MHTYSYIYLPSPRSLGRKLGRADPSCSDLLVFRLQLAHLSRSRRAAVRPKTATAEVED